MCKGMIKLDLLDNCFFHLFTELQIWHRKPLKFDLGCVFRKLKFSKTGALNKDLKCKKKFFR